MPLATVSTDTSAGSMDTGVQGYLSLGMLVPHTAMGLDYTRWVEERPGVIQRDAHDPMDGHRGAVLPWLGVGLRMSSKSWLGGEYQSVAGVSEGRIRVRAHIPIVSLTALVPAPTEDGYRHVEARVWAGYDMIDTPRTLLRGYAGLYFTRLYMKAENPDLGEISDTLTGALPLLGLTWKQGDPSAGRWSLDWDYGSLGVNGIHARATGLTLAWEKQVVKGWVGALGYTRRDFFIEAHRQKYDALIDLRLHGLFMKITQNF